MKHHELDGFWIDQESINQEDKEEKETAMQSMDLVYSNNDWPIALLWVRIETQEDLDLLIRLLRGQLIDEQYLRKYGVLKS